MVADELRVDLIASGNLVQVLQQAIAALQQAATAAAPLTAALQANTVAAANAAQGLQRVATQAQQTATAKRQLNDTVSASVGLWSALPGPLGQVAGAFASLHVEITRNQEAMLATASAMSAIGAAIAGGLGEAVKDASEFQRTLAEIQVVAGSTGDELQAFRAKALELGAASQFNSQQVAAGLRELLQAGLSASEALGSIDAVTRAAMIGNQGLDAATKMVANTMRQFGMDASQTTHIVDAMIVAAQGSTLKFSEFGNLITNLRGRTQALGLSFEEVTAVEMLMVNAGIPAAAASTALGTAMDRLGKATRTGTDEASQGIRALGLNVWDANGRFIGFAGVLDQIAAKLPSMTQEEQAHALALLGGSRASGAFSSVLQQQQKVMVDGNEVVLKGTDLLRYWTDQLRNADGASARAAQTIGATLDAQMKNLRGSLGEAAIQLGTQFLPLMQAVVPQVMALVNAFVQAPPVLHEAAAAGLAAVAAFGSIAGTVTVGSLALGALGTSLAAVLGPLAAVGAAAAALTIAWQTNWGDVQGVTIRVLAAIQPDLERLGTMLGNFGQGVQDVLQQAAAVWTFFGGSAQTAGDGVSLAGDLITAAIQTIIDIELRLAEVWGAAWQEISIHAVDAINVVLPLMEQLGDWLGTNLPPLIDAIQAQWAAFWAEAGPTLSAFWAVAQPILTDFRDWLGTAIPAALGTLRDIMGDVWGFLGPLLGQLKDLIGPLIGAIASAIGTKAHEVNEALRAALDTSAVDGEARTAMQAVGQDMMAGTAVGIALGSPTVALAMQAAIDAAIAAAKAAAGIQSPSKVAADQIGVPIGQGIAQGILTQADQVAAAAARVATGGVTAAKTALNEAWATAIGSNLTGGSYGKGRADPTVRPEYAPQDAINALLAGDSRAYDAWNRQQQAAFEKWLATQGPRGTANAGITDQGINIFGGATNGLGVTSIAGGGGGGINDLLQGLAAVTQAATPAKAALGQVTAGYWGIGQAAQQVAQTGASAMQYLVGSIDEVSLAARKSFGEALQAGQLLIAGMKTAVGLTYNQIYSQTATQGTSGSTNLVGTLGVPGAYQNLPPGTYNGIPVVSGSPITAGILHGYADGGLITSPTLLTDAASGRTFGMMAEAGPERIGGGGNAVTIVVQSNGLDILRDNRYWEQVVDRQIMPILRKRRVVTA